VKEKKGKKNIVCNGDQMVATSAEKASKGQARGGGIDDNRVQAAPGPGSLLRQNDVGECLESD